MQELRNRKNELIITKTSEKLNKSYLKEVSINLRQMGSTTQPSGNDLEEDYRVLADFNNTVLAGHPTKFGVQFITWEWVRNRTSLHHGVYYGPDPDSYAAAKQGFATHSGLVPKSALFTPEQLTEAYRNVHETLDEREPLTEQRRELVEKAAEQIERGIPDLTERVNLSNQQELELGLTLNGTEVLKTAKCSSAEN